MPAMSGIKAVAILTVAGINNFNSVAGINNSDVNKESIVDVSRLHYCYSSNPIFIPSYVR
jgi:hypothetical protein